MKLLSPRGKWNAGFGKAEKDEDGNPTGNDTPEPDEDLNTLRDEGYTQGDWFLIFQSFWSVSM